MSHPISKIVHVANKQLAQDNAVSVEVVQLTTELNEITKSLAAYPSQLGASTLNARSQRSMLVSLESLQKRSKNTNQITKSFGKLNEP